MSRQSSLQPNEWISRYADQLYGYAFVRVNDESTAEDLVQDTFLSALKARDTYKGDASEKTWLFAILKNKITDHYRKQTRNPEIPIPSRDSSDRFFEEDGHWAKDAYPQDWSDLADTKINSKEFYLALDRCKKKLQELQQAVFVMKYMEDMDATEICKVLNITPSNYWVLIHRAKLSLRNCLEKTWIHA